MQTEEEICSRYEVAFSSIAALDRRYYLNPSASISERRDYAARQELLVQLRYRFYTELRACREYASIRRCRSVIRPRFRSY